MTTQTVIWVSFTGYCLLLLLIGAWASRKVHDESDFFIAGKGEGGGLGAWTAGLSYAASTSSAWVLLGFTGKVYSSGLVALWLLPGIFGGYILTWLVMGPRLNAETEERGHITIVDFMTADITGGWKRGVRVLAAVLILFCFVFYISSQFDAAGKAMSQIFGIDKSLAILLGALIIVFYCLLGGFWAASVTDMLQAIVMLAGCIIVPLAVIHAAGGLSAIRTGVLAHAPQNYLSLTHGAVGMAGLGVIMGTLGIGLGAAGQPQLINRIMSVKTRKARVQAAFITIGWGVLIFTGLTLMAFAARAMGEGLGFTLTSKGEDLFFKAASAFLPAVMAGLVIAAVMSAVMSTVDSLLLAAASAVSHDMGIRYKNSKAALTAGRLAMIGVAVIAVLLTLFLPKDIYSRVLFSWVALGAAFGPITLVRCLGWKVKAVFVFMAMLGGFLIAVLASSHHGGIAGNIEKWGSWLFALMVLFAGRERTPK